MLCSHFRKIDDEMKEYTGKLDKITKEEIEVYTKMQNSAGENDQAYSEDPELNQVPVSLTAAHGQHGFHHDDRVER